MKEYIKLENATKEANVLEVEVYYSKGGINYFTYKDEPRGFWLSVSPMLIEGNLKTYTSFSGLKKFIKAVNRYSVKAEAEANRLAENFKRELIEKVCSKNNLAVPAAV